MMGKRRFDAGRNYGNSATYLIARIKRDRPDIIDEFLRRIDTKGWNKNTDTLRAIAREMGYLPNPDHDEKLLTEMLRMWNKADDDTRAVFEWLKDEPVLRIKGGNEPWQFDESAPSELVESVKARNMSEIARHCGVSRESVRRWARGQAKPRAEPLAKLKELAAQVNAEFERHEKALADFDQ